MRIVETIQHGQYSHRLYVDVPEDSPSAESLDRLLADSPYNFDMLPVYRDRVLNELCANGKSSHGWAEYTLEREYAKETRRKDADTA